MSLIQNQTKALQEKETTNHGCKNAQQNISKSTMYKAITHNKLIGFIPGMQSKFGIQKSINITHHINKLRKKNHMMISMYEEKAFDKIQCQCMMKTPRKLGAERTSSTS